MFRSFAFSLAAFATLLVCSPAYAGDNDPLSLSGVIGGVRSQTSARKTFGKEVVTFEPTWIIRQLIDRGATRAAISECNAQGLLTCDEAKFWLQSLDAQCNTVLLGIIDLGTHPGVDPKSVFDSEHPELMLFATSANDTVPRYVNLFGKTEPNFFAAAMCPEESEVFGPAFHALKMMQTIGRQPH